MNFKKFICKKVHISFFSFRWDNKLEDFDIGNILIDKKSHKNILICYDISCKTLIGPKP